MAKIAIFYLAFITFGNLYEQNKINKECIGHNVKYDGVEHFEGIVCRSNYDFDYKDVSPAFDFKLFKELLEND